MNVALRAEIATLRADKENIFRDVKSLREEKHHMLEDLASLKTGLDKVSHEVYICPA